MLRELSVHRGDVSVVVYGANTTTSASLRSRRNGRRAAVVHFNVEWAKGVRARLRRASVDGLEDAPRYSQDEIDRLGAAGKAYKMKNGTFAWPCADRRDLLNRLNEWTPDVPEALDVKAFLKRRAILMRMDELLPKSWYTPPQKPIN